MADVIRYSTNQNAFRFSLISESALRDRSGLNFCRWSSVKFKIFAEQNDKQRYSVQQHRINDHHQSDTGSDFIAESMLASSFWKIITMHHLHTTSLFGVVLAVLGCALAQDSPNYMGVRNVRDRKWKIDSVSAWMLYDTVYDAVWMVLDKAILVCIYCPIWRYSLLRLIFSSRIVGFQDYLFRCSRMEGRGSQFLRLYYTRYFGDWECSNPVLYRTFIAAKSKCLSAPQQIHWRFYFHAHSSSIGWQHDLGG